MKLPETPDGLAPTARVRELGAYIRDQRTAAQISLRQLAQLAGVSNPYLSQIERGLRKPSAEILSQIAKALRISAKALYVHAGLLDEHPADTDLVTAVRTDPHLADRQKQALLDIYEAFRRENAVASSPTEIGTPPDAAKDPGPDVGTMTGGTGPEPDPSSSGGQCAAS